MSDQKDTQPDPAQPLEGTAMNGGTAPDGTAPEVGDHALSPLDAAAAGREPARSPGKGGGVQDLVDEPAKVMRIGTMVKQLLEEVKSAPLDKAARVRLAEIHERSIKELEDGLAPALVQELERIHLPFSDATTPSDAELRIAQAQLVGWLEGLFHGIQTAIAAQHSARQYAAAQMQLRQLPPGTMIAPGVIIGENGEPQRAAARRPGADPSEAAEAADPDHGPGQYL